MPTKKALVRRERKRRHAKELEAPKIKRAAPRATDRLPAAKACPLPPDRCGDYVYPGSELTDEQVEFLKAIQKYKEEKRRPHPTWPEVLKIAESLGYRKLPTTDGN